MFSVPRDAQKVVKVGKKAMVDEARNPVIACDATVVVRVHAEYSLLKQSVEL